MRQDQIDRLNTLAEDVGEVFLQEADPNTWTGAGAPLADLDPKKRGDRYWDKKNAIQTGTLLARILDLAERDKRSADTKMPEDDAEKEVSRYEKRAKDLLDGIAAKAKH
jgi:hypothetical protein